MINSIRRILFVLGPIALLFSGYKLYSLTPKEYNIYLDSALEENLSLFGGLYIIYYVWAIIFSIYDMLKNSRPKLFLWLPVVLLGLFVGPFVYYEKYILPKEKIQSELEVDQKYYLSNFSQKEITQLRIRRFIAAMIDYIIFVYCAVIVIVLTGERVATGWELKDSINTLFIPLIWVMMFPVTEGLFGKTLGKWITKLKVVDYSGNDINIKMSFKRHIVDLFDVIIITALLVFSIKKEKYLPRRLGDRFAKTIVYPNIKGFKSGV